MDQTPKQQIIESLKTAESVVITTSQDPTVDQAASVIALTEILRGVDKKAVAAFEPSQNERVSFLNPSQFADAKLATVRDFIVELNESNAKVDQFRYDRQDNKLRIYITPKQGSFTPDDVTTTEGDFNVDTLITLGVSNQNELFTTVAEHNDLISKTKVLSLSVGSKKSNIPGATTWHDGDASSLAELLVGVGEALGADLNKETSTALLTGIMAETHNFTTDKTSPKVMTMAAQLMAAGANQQLIVKNLNVPETPEAPQTPAPQQTQQQPSSQQPAQKEQPTAEPVKQPEPVNEQVGQQEQQTEPLATTPKQPQGKPVQQESAPAVSPQDNQGNNQTPSPEPQQPVPSEEKQTPEQQAPNPDDSALFKKPDTSQEFSVNSQGQIVTSSQQQEQPQQQKQERPTPPEPQEPQDVLNEQQAQDQPTQTPEQTEDTAQGPDTLNQARDAVQQAFSGPGTQQSATPPQNPQEGKPSQDDHPMISTDRTYHKESNDQNNGTQSQQPPNPFNSAGTSEDGNGSNNAIL